MIHRATSAGREPHPADPFFTMRIAFVPLGAATSDPQTDFPTLDSRDMLHLRYHAPVEREQPYRGLLFGLKPGDGVSVGDGWREVEIDQDGRPLRLRWDDEEWNRKGGTLPRRLAAGYSAKGIFDHHVELTREGWSAAFKLSGSKVSDWRAAHATAEAIDAWLRTKPADRDGARIFVWPGREEEGDA